MKKLFALIILLLPAVVSVGQITPTNEILITGEIEHELTITLSDLDKFEKHAIPDIEITNHLGEKKGTAKNLKGILMKDILSAVQFKTDNPKLLSEFYLVFLASDGYKVVYSWNEIFNSPTGSGVYLITEKEGKTIGQMDQRMLTMTISDHNTGRRNIKALSKIIARRAGS